MQSKIIKGLYFAGEIVAVGQNVNAWSVGDAVYARPDLLKNLDLTVEQQHLLSEFQRELSSGQTD